MYIIDGQEWKKELRYNAKGDILCTMPNLETIIRNDENLSNIVFNEMRHTIDVIGELPWKRTCGAWNNTDFPCLQMYLEKEYGLYSPRKCKDALQAVLSSEKRYHPVKEYLERLKWDGEERMKHLLIDYLGAEDTEYVREVTAKTLIAAVARIYEPGIKFDTMLVLCGKQGIGKSTLFHRLGSSWYSDSMSISDMKDKTAAEKLQGIWIMELSELAGIKKIDVEIVKSFLSRMDDQYRAPYELYVEAHPRSSIIVGTTNKTDGFLRDITGNRRFWPVCVNDSGLHKVWELTDYEVDQIWAEAKTRYWDGEVLYLDRQAETVAKNRQRMAMESDPRQGIIEEFLENHEKKQTCLMELWCECFEKERADMSRRDAFELEGILLQIDGWHVYDGNTTGKMRIPNYGVQKAFVKSGSEGGEEKHESSEE